MNQHIKSVKKFHETFNAPILKTPQIPSKERSDLRVRLLQEELDEIKEAIENGDMTQVIDGFCDLLYILNGSILEFGMGEIFDDCFNEVQRSNMSKACLSEEDAIKTLDHYMKKDGTKCYYKKMNDKWVVYRSSDDKILKSINYSEANFDRIINETK